MGESRKLAELEMPSNGIPNFLKKKVFSNFSMVMRPLQLRFKRLSGETKW